MAVATLVITILAGFQAQDIEYTRELMKKKKVTVGDLSFVFYSLLGEEKTAKEAAEAAEAVVEKGWMPKKWAEDLDENASLGEVSYMICKVLDIKGGFMMRTFGMTKRYCYRECVYQRLVGPNGPHSRVSGRDLLGVYTTLENILEERAEEAGEIEREMLEIPQQEPDPEEDPSKEDDSAEEESPEKEKPAQKEPPQEKKESPEESKKKDPQGRKGDP